MTIGTSLFLIAVGAIVRYAVKDTWKAVDLPTVGLILMIVGFFGLVLGLYMAFVRGRPDPSLGEDDVVVRRRRMRP
jgi:predicted Na+-dependent transporter